MTTLLAADPILAAVAAQSPAIRPLSLTDGREYRINGERVYALEPEALASATISTLRGLQLSERKAFYLIDAAHATLDGRLSISRLAALGDEEYLRVMTQIRGIGRWTADWFAVRVLGQPVVVAGDIGVRKAVGRLYGVGLPTEHDVHRLTAHWGTAAHIAQQLVLESCGSDHLIQAV